MQNDNRIVIKKELRLFDCFCLVTGCIIGAGIFISPKGILQYTHSVGWSMVVWVISGVLSCFGALSFVELGTFLPISGGDFTFLLYSFGPLFAFLRVWTLIVAVRTGPWALLAITIGTYMTGDSECHATPVSTRLVAVCVLSLVIYINCSSVTISRKVQNVFTVGKIAGLILIVVAGWIHVGEDNVTSFEKPFQSFDSEPISVRYFPLALFSGLFAFSGWQFLPMVTEEIIDPGRTMPLAIMLSMGFITTIYLLANVAYLLVLNPMEILNSDAVAMTFGVKVFGWWWWTMPLAVCLSCLGSINGGIFSTSRLFHVASRVGHLPSFVAMLHVRKKTPLPAAIITLPICILMMFVDDIYSLINYLSFSRWLFLGMTSAAVPYFRWKHPGVYRPFTVPLFIPIVFTMSALFMVIMSIVSSPTESLIGLGITLSGIPVYILGVLWKSKPACFVRGMRQFTIFMQKLFLIVPEESPREEEDSLELLFFAESHDM